MQKETQHFLTRIGENIAKEDISTLQEVIRYHRELYYQKESPIISDKEFDDLFQLLVISEEKHNINDVTSPTKQVDHLLSEQFSKSDHKYPMQSLDNTYDASDLHDFDTRIGRILTKAELQTKVDYLVELKFDGLGVALTYENGELTKGVTRGNGSTGENITINVMQIANIPKKIPCTESREIRGEIIMPTQEFHELNKARQETDKKPFSNPRNAASGSVRQKDPNVSANRPLEFYAYSCPDLEDTSNTYDNLLEEIGSYGFTLSPWMKKVSKIEEVIDIIERDFGGKKPTFPFEIDGLVIKVNNIELWSTLGNTAHHPRSAISYKFPAEYERTKILSIEQSVGRTGTITPVANVEPVNIGGVIVRRATLHNYDEVAKKGVMIGDYVFIHRAGEVIPEIISPIVETRTGDEEVISEPKQCPICNTPTIKEGEKIALLCPNYHCPAKIQGRIEYFVSRGGLDIDGLGPRQIELFLEKEWIQDISSIFELPKYKEQILELEGYKSKSVENLIKSLEASKAQPIDIFLRALGIPGVGKRTAKVIGSLFGSIKELTSFSISYEQLEELDDIGPETARNIIEFFETNSSIIKKLLLQMDIQFINKEVTGTALSGKSFCVTGSFENHSRDQIHEMIEQNGGEIRTSVSKRLDYLIAGEKAGSKKKKAEDFEVVVWNINTLLNTIN